MLIGSRQKLDTFDSPPTLSIIFFLRITRSVQIFWGLYRNSFSCIHVDKMSKKVAPVIGIFKKKRLVNFLTLLSI